MRARSAAVGRPPVRSSSQSAQSAPKATRPAGLQPPSAHGRGTAARYRSRCWRRRVVSSSRARPGRHQNHSDGLKTEALSADLLVLKLERRSLASSCQRKRTSASSSTGARSIPLSRSSTLSTVNGRTPRGRALSSSASLESSPSGRKATSRSPGGTSACPVEDRTRAMTSRLRRPGALSDGSGIGSSARSSPAVTVGMRPLVGSPRKESKSPRAASRSSTSRAAKRSSRRRKRRSALGPCHGGVSPGRHRSPMVSQRPGASRGRRSATSLRAASPSRSSGNPSPVFCRTYGAGKARPIIRTSSGRSSASTPAGRAPLRSASPPSSGTQATPSSRSSTSARNLAADGSSGSPAPATRFARDTRSTAPPAATFATAISTSPASPLSIAPLRSAEPR